MLMITKKVQYLFNEAILANIPAQMMLPSVNLHLAIALEDGMTILAIKLKLHTVSCRPENRKQLIFLSTTS